MGKIPLSPVSAAFELDHLATKPTLETTVETTSHSFTLAGATTQGVFRCSGALNAGLDNEKVCFAYQEEPEALQSK
jgi:hypothetical protein